MRWPKACLGDVAQVVSGATPKSSVDHYWDGDIPWITPADLSNLAGKEVSVTSRRITAAGLSSCSARLLPARSVLFSSRAPIGHVAINTVPMATNQGFKSFVPDHEILSPDFLYWWLKSNKSYLQSLGRGATFKEVSKEIVESIEIPLPPLEEQRRIAAILDKAQVMSYKSRLSGELASSLIESEMIQRFGRPGENQAHSRLLSLVEAGVSVIDCPHSTPKWTEEGRVCLRTSNLGKGDWIWHDTRRISDDDFQERSRRAPLEPGDIVLSREGTVGIAAIVTSDMDVCMGQRLVQLKLDARHLTPEYLLAQLLYLLKPERISHAMTGSTSKHINVKDLRELKISCPPIEEQSAFDNFCKQTKKMRARIALLEKNSKILSRSIHAASFCS
ncbi:restriction endonuclease subunit S [Microcystis elabens FACHB-917]|nr:restriction endonuclease subunit S [Microcystis elabens FACHB-917]